MYKCEIIRRDSEYNKYIKWFAEGKSMETDSTFSFGYRTRKEAEDFIEKINKVEPDYN
jgi:hypothetical protein